MPGGPILATRGQLRLRRGPNSARATALPVCEEGHCWVEMSWQDFGCDALRCDPATETIFFAGHVLHAEHWFESSESRKRNFWRQESLACLVARADGAYARQSIRHYAEKYEAWMSKEKGHWGRWQDVASPLGNASYYGRATKACADECGGCATIAASAEELLILANLERAYGMSGGGAAMAPLGNEADAACFGRTFPSSHYQWQWFWITTGHALVIAALVVLCLVPPLAACCASHDWCPYHRGRATASRSSAPCSRHAWAAAASASATRATTGASGAAGSAAGIGARSRAPSSP